MIYDLDAWRTAKVLAKQRRDEAMPLPCKTAHNPLRSDEPILLVRRDECIDEFICLLRRKE
jgi:hypothetical protein